jgi:hypothetical protein
MALVATVSLEMESFKGLLWYYWYRLRYCPLQENSMKIFPVIVPPALAPYVPYLKFIAAAAGVVATAITILMTSPPSWAYLVIAVVTSLGVYSIPNISVKAVLSDGEAAVNAAEKAVKDARGGNVVQAEQDVSSAVKDVQSTVQDVHAITQALPKLP